MSTSDFVNGMIRNIYHMNKVNASRQQVFDRFFLEVFDYFEMLMKFLKAYFQIVKVLRIHLYV